MTSSPQGRAPPQPLLKAPFTTQSSLLDAVASNGNGNSTSKVPAKARSARTRPETLTADFASHSATLSLIRRILVFDKSAKIDSRASPKPVEEILPPLTSSNDVDVQLYAIVAIIIKDFVNTWYANITPDHQFVDEVLQIIAHCSRAVEQRLRHIDIVELLLDEIPALFERHVVAYRTAVTASARLTYSTEVHHVYHVLNPHPALDPLPQAGDPVTEAEQKQNEFIYRQLLVNGALAVLLPTDDLRNAPLRLLLGDIIADVIIGQALAGKICEAWFLHDTITKIVTIICDRVQPKASGHELREEAKTRLEKFGLLSTEEDEKRTRSSALGRSVISVWFWQISQGIFLVFLILRFIVKGIGQAGSIPHRSSKRSRIGVSPTTSKGASTNEEHDECIQPVLGYSLYGAIATILRLDNHMPWLTSTFMFWQHVLLRGFGHTAAPNSVLDRFLHSTIQTHVFPPALIAPILLNLRIALFPNNSLGPPAPPAPSIEERLAIRRRAAESILSLVPPIVARTLFNTSNDEEILEAIEQDILDTLGDSYLNKHLIYGILELVLCRLIPELTEGSVSELLAERGVLLGQEKEGERPVEIV